MLNAKRNFGTRREVTAIDREHVHERNVHNGVSDGLVRLYYLKTWRFQKIEDGEEPKKKKERDEGCTHLMRMLVVLGCAEYCMVVYSPPRTFSMFIKVWF